MAYRKTALTAVIAATASSASMAMAQEAPADETAGLQGIVVTARKRRESDLVVPISIQAYDSEKLERRGVQSLNDIASITPGVIISDSVGSFGGNIMMRRARAPRDRFGYINNTRAIAFRLMVPSAAADTLTE